MESALMAMGLLLGWGWHGVSGNGVLKTESRPLSGFTCVANESPFPVNVSQADHFTVSLNVDSNLLPVVETTIDGHCLRVSIQKGTSVTNVHGAISVALPTLTSAAVAGSGSLSVRGFPSLEHLELKLGGSGSLAFEGAVSACSVSLSGSGQVTLSGHAERLEVTMAGSGPLVATAFPTKDLKLVLTGSGKASVSATRDAEIDLTGSGVVRADLASGAARAHITGSGEVHWTGSAHMDEAMVLGNGRIVHE